MSIHHSEEDGFSTRAGIQAHESLILCLASCLLKPSPPAVKLANQQKRAGPTHSGQSLHAPPCSGTSLQRGKQTGELEQSPPGEHLSAGWEKKHLEETALGLTLQHAEIGIQCLHLTCDNGTELAVKGKKKMQVITLYWTFLFHGLDRAHKGLSVRRPSPFGLSLKCFP